MKLQRILTLFFILALALGFAGSALAAPVERYVATTGANSGDCSVTACLTINYAVGQAVAGDTINVAAGTYVGAATISKSLTLKGAQFDVAVSGRTAGDAAESTISGLVSVTAADVVINGFSLTNPSQPYAVSLSSATSNVTIAYNIIDTVGSASYSGSSGVHAIAVNNGPDGVSILNNRFNNIQAGIRSANGIGILDSTSLNDSTGLLIQGNVFSNITSGTKGAYGVIINNKTGAPGAQILDNSFSNLSGGWTHAIGLEGPTLGAIVTGNSFSGLTAAGLDKSAIFFEKNPVGNTVTITDNQFNGTNFYGVAIHPNDLPGGSNGYNYGVTANDNWWNGADGPSGQMGPGVTAGDWCADANCTLIISAGPITIPASMPAADVQTIIDTAAPGTTLIFEAGTFTPAGGYLVGRSDLTFQLNAATLIQPSSPCFTISGNNITITGGVCEPSSGADGILTGAAVNNLVIKGMEIRGAAGDDGIYIGHAVTNLQIVDNYIHDLGGDGVEYAAAVSGVHEVQGNLFQNNTGSGVNNSGAEINVEYNAWGDIAGPAGAAGDGAIGVDYTPWTHAALFTVSSGSPVADKVAVGSQITYTVKIDAAQIYGAQFNFAFDNTKLSVVSIVDLAAFQGTGSSAFDISTPAEANTAGYVTFTGFRTTALDNAGEAIFEVTFEGTAAGVSPLNFDETGDSFSMVPPSGASNTVYASALTDGSVTIFAAYTVSGRIDLQGRSNDSGAAMTFGVGLNQGYGPFSFSASDQWGAISASGIVSDTYGITVVMPRYLDVTGAAAKQFVAASNDVLSTLVLFGGDASDDGVINLSDATMMGTQYSTAGPEGDINNDGVVNLLDLTLMGGNYLKTSATAYSSWIP